MNCKPCNHEFKRNLIDKGGSATWFGAFEVNAIRGDINKAVVLRGIDLKFEKKY